MVTKNELNDYAKKLMFQMNDNEYETLLKEFEVILKQMDFIDKIDGINKVEPMTFPFITYQANLRKDEIKDTLSIEDILRNAKEVENNQIKVPKVVE